MIESIAVAALVWLLIKHTCLFGNHDYTPWTKWHKHHLYPEGTYARSRVCRRCNHLESVYEHAIDH